MFNDLCLKLPTKLLCPPSNYIWLCLRIFMKFLNFYLCLNCKGWTINFTKSRVSLLSALDLSLLWMFLQLSVVGKDLWAGTAVFSFILGCFPNPVYKKIVVWLNETKAMLLWTGCLHVLETTNIGDTRQSGILHSYYKIQNIHRCELLHGMCDKCLSNGLRDYVYEK